MKKVMRYIILCAMLVLLGLLFMRAKTVDYSEYLYHKKDMENSVIWVINTSNQTIYTDAIIKPKEGSEKNFQICLESNEFTKLSFEEVSYGYMQDEDLLLYFENTVTDSKIVAQGLLISFCCTVFLTTGLLIFAEVIALREKRNQQEKGAGG